MANRTQLTYEGPFLRTGNVFSDPEPPSFDLLPEGELGPRDYIEVSRGLLQACKRSDYSLFHDLPEYLERHRNGILWRNVALLYAFGMPEREIELFVHRFEQAVFQTRDPLVARWVLALLLESGIPRFVHSSTRVLTYLHPRTDWGDIARTYAIIIEPGIGFDPKKSKIIAAVERLSVEDFAAFVANETADMVARHGGSEPVRIHAGTPVVLADVLIDLAEAVRAPYFFVRIHFEKVLLEAFTGFDLSSGFDRLQLRQDRFYDALVSLSDTFDLDALEPGRRYFFGKPLD